jgi:hypothetical protein
MAIGHVNSRILFNRSPATRARSVLSGLDNCKASSRDRFDSRATANRRRLSLPRRWCYADNSGRTPSYQAVRPLDRSSTWLWVSSKSTRFHKDTVNALNLIEGDPAQIWHDRGPAREALHRFPADKQDTTWRVHVRPLGYFFLAQRRYEQIFAAERATL